MGNRQRLRYTLGIERILDLVRAVAVAVSLVLTGERICWCDACKYIGCVHSEIQREDSGGPVEVPTENNSSVSVHETTRARFQDSTWRPGSVSLPWRPGQGKGQRNGKGVQGKGQRSWWQGH